MKQTFFTVVAACGLLLAPALAGAQTTPPADPPAQQAMKAQHAQTAGVSAADKAFMKEAAIGGMAEVDLGNLAQQKASSQDVKDFGKRMVDDHSKANDELKSLAEQKSVTLPTDLDAKSKATRARLEKLDGAAFDKAYMSDMVSDHVKDVALFRKESKSAHDSDLKAWAAKTLPTLEEHLTLAKQTKAKVGGMSKTPKTGGR
ncbi:MAG TPA: DUF4142 domain-containing protein [Vicinamibacterales bacterium]|nr:DUF4142 domain-containing protein [Vicinamibacterales bacterium]